LLESYTAVLGGRAGRQKMKGMRYFLFQNFVKVVFRQKYSILLVGQKNLLTKTLHEHFNEMEQSELNITLDGVT